MGKGKRNRNGAGAARKALSFAAAAERKAASAARIARICCFVMLPVMVITLLTQLWSIVTVQTNLSEQRYTADEVTALTRTLPLGQIGIGLMLAGAVSAAVLLLRKKEKAAWIGTGLTVAAGVLFVLFALSLGDIFAYDPLRDRGLRFGDLLLRHFTALLTPLLLLKAQLFAHRAAKQRALIAMMTESVDDIPTVSLQEIPDDAR